MAEKPSRVQTPAEIPIPQSANAHGSIILILDRMASAGGRGAGVPKGRLTKEGYDRLMAERPEKVGPESVNYRAAPEHDETTETEDTPECGTCKHFFTNAAGGIQVCEIMRPPDENVDEDYVCDWWTKDGKKFPLLKSGKSG